MLAEIGFITLSFWCHLLFPGRERKVLARQQWGRMTGRCHGYVIVFKVEQFKAQNMLTSVCRVPFLTCIHTFILL